MSAPLADTSVPIAEGDVLAGKYRVERVLGQGAMGLVVAATHLQLQQKVAIKFLTGRATREVVGRFLREARSAVKLRNEHVARVIDVGELEGGLPYMVMEYLSGQDLQQVSKAEGALSIHEAIGYVLQVCEAMAEAHSAGIIHRDLKPSNLFLTTSSDGSKMVKVLDFGISKETGDTGEGEAGMALTRTEAVLGSPLYMSIQQMRSSRDVDQRDDIYSIGAILYQLLTGRVPFEAQTFPELILKVASEEPPPPSSLRADIPAALEQAILRCLDKDRTRRFSNVGDLAAAIAPFALDEHIGSAERALRTIDKAGGPGSTTLSPAALRATRSSMTGTTSRTASSWSASTGGDPRAARMKTIGLAILALVLGAGTVMALVVFMSKPSANAGSGVPAGSSPGDTAAPPSTETALPSITPFVVPAPYEPQATATAQPTAKPTTTAAAPPPPSTGAPPRPTSTGAAPAPTPSPTPPPATTPPPAPTPTVTQKKNPLDIDIK
ncbi:MAG: serine/threonine-protein kinase [Polyangiaceae bacterium]